MKSKKEIFRFLIVTACVGAMDFGLYFLLIRFLSFSISKGISFIFGNIAGYLFHKYWTFKKNKSSYHEVGRNLIIGSLLLGVNVLTNHSILDFWPHSVFLALVIASILTMLLGFVCKKWWVFK